MLQHQNAISKWLHNLTPAQLLVLFYFLALLFSALLLSLPIAYKDGVTIPFIDKLFLSVSALSVTGLTSFSIADSLSTVGIIFLSLILHLGLLGIMSISTIVLMLFGRRIGIAERRLIMQDQNMYHFGGMVQLIKQIIVIVFTIELVSVIALGVYFLKFYASAKEAFYYAYFYTISALSNGGFALAEDSIAFLENHYIVQLLIMLLIVFGAIGFPVLIEVKDYIFAPKKEKIQFRFSLYTKLTSVTFFILIAVGTLFLYLFDAKHFFANKGILETFFYTLFQSVTTRSAGLSTFDISLLTEANQLFLSFLMFIGASPSSAGGGIRTTTFALVVFFIITYARGGKKIKIFNREIYNDDLYKAVTVTLLAIFIVLIGLLCLTIFEPFPVMALLFEVTSAFGTVGLSLGITEKLTVWSKLILMIIMFIGRIGLVTFMFTFRKNDNREAIRYPKERIMIG